MKIPDHEKEEILNGLIPFLDPTATEIKREIKKVDGAQLLNEGIRQTEKGAPIFSGVMYEREFISARLVDHKQRICQLIADARDRENMYEALAVHLSTYATDPALVIKSIPVNLSAINFPTSKN
jgi:hypothetical protein